MRAFVLLILACFLTQNQSALAEIAERRIAVHDAGLQRLGLTNDGALGIPRTDSLLYLNLEYPKGSGTIFLYSGGIWIGAMKDGEPVVCSTMDEDNGTNEFGQLEFMTEAEEASGESVSIGWLQKGTTITTDVGRDVTFHDGIYKGVGSAGVDDDGDGLVDEDPAGDISADYIDNDGDGLVDHEDSDLDGDVVPRSRDDDGDGFLDEDDCAIATRELVTAYVDTCESCIEGIDMEGFHPLGIRVVQHSYQWSFNYCDDLIRLDYDISNISAHTFEDLCIGMFFDFDVGHISQDGNGRSEDDYAYYINDSRIAVGADNDGDEDLLSSRAFGIRFLNLGSDETSTTYKNFDRLAGAEPETDLSRYRMMSSGDIDPDWYEEADWRMVLAVGPLGDLAPGETLPISIALLNGQNDDQLRAAARTAELILDPDFFGPAAPGPPIFSVEAQERSATITWDTASEASVEPILDDIDFQGYNIWRTIDGVDWTLLSTYDLPDTLGLNAGWPPPQSENSVYTFIDSLLTSGIAYHYVVTAFDNGDNGDGIHSISWDERNNGVGIVESPHDETTWMSVIPAALPAEAGTIDQVHVIPNPYIGSSYLETGQSASHIDFRGLPPVCVINIYSLAGDEVRTIRHHNGLSWESWDLCNDEGQKIAGGIYLFRVQSDGNDRIGKFLVIR